MDTCDTCLDWKRLDNEEGECTHPRHNRVLTASNGVRAESEEPYTSATLFTGPKFGCIHHSPLSSISSSIASDLSAYLDASLKTILDEYLGRTDWKPAELKNRCQWVVADHINPGRQSLFIDGIELCSIRRFPDCHVSPCSTRVHFNIDFRRLWNPVQSTKTG